MAINLMLSLLREILSMSQRKFVSQEVLKSIEEMVCDRKTDLQISEILGIGVSDVYKIRRNVLKVSVYGSRRRCTKCGKDKSVTCFNKKSIYKDWCIICRKEHGGERGGGRPFGSKGYKVRKGKKFVAEVCLRCDKKFKSEVFVGFDGRIDHYRCCRFCQVKINGMEQVSI
jgi:hypothetical protein